MSTPRPDPLPGFHLCFFDDCPGDLMAVYWHRGEIERLCVLVEQSADNKDYAEAVMLVHELGKHRSYATAELQDTVEKAIKRVPAHYLEAKTAPVDVSYEGT